MRSCNICLFYVRFLESSVCINFFVHGKKYKQSESSLFAVCFIITVKIERNFQNKIGTEMKNKVLFT